MLIKEVKELGLDLQNGDMAYCVFDTDTNKEKNINIYPYIKENLNEAILRSKRLEQYHLKNNHTIGNIEANPNTEVYKVIEYLTKNN